MAPHNERTHTTAIHAGMSPAEHRGAVSVPIYQTSTFAFRDVEEGSERFAGRSPGFVYSRMGNPTNAALEEAVAALEGGAGAIATATGMAAISTTLLALLRENDHVVATRPLYGATARLIAERLSRYGIQSTMVAANDIRELERAVRPDTRLIVIETPANPTLDVVDISAAARIAKSAGIKLLVDNTFAGPHLQRPLEFGADVVVHSATKSLNGHSDVVAGVITADDTSVLRALRDTAIAFGTTIDPHQAWLVLRGLRTLGMRVERAQANAIELAGWLEAHPLVERVYFPGLASHPQHELAKRQMKGPGSVIAFELRGGLDAGRMLMNNVRLITLAVSLGGVESLIEHPASMTHAAMSPAQQEAEGIRPGLVRFSVGCEDVEDLRDDLRCALAFAETYAS